MKVLVLYRPKSDHARGIQEFLHELNRRQPLNHIKVIDVGTREGNATASLYDVMAYPAFLAIDDEGKELKRWTGDEKPLIDEVTYYTQ
jgi:hypothetical protein